MYIRINERKSIRMPGYDYSWPNYYFVTICVKNRVCLLGNISDGRVVLNEWGRVVRECWLDLPNHYLNAKLDEFVIMPDHVHLIICLDDVDPVGAGFKPAPTRKYPLSEIIRGFKTFSARKINLMRNNSGIPFWQRNYYERIIRNERELENARIYIRSNPILVH